MISRNSFEKVLSTDINTIAENTSGFSISEKTKRENLMSHYIVDKYELNKFQVTLKEHLKKFDHKLKESKEKISKMINQFKHQEKTFNKSLEISTKNLVFIYDINSRVDMEHDDISKALNKRTDNQVMNLNYYNAHRYGNIIKEKYNMNSVKNKQEFSRLIQIEKSKHLEEMLDKTVIKKNNLIKRIKIKNI